MAEDLTGDDGERERFIETLGNGILSRGFVVVERLVLEEVRQHLGMTERELLDRLFSYLRNGGRLAKVKETRDLDFVDFHWEFHYDMWPELSNRTILVYARFKDAAKLDDRMIFIVRAHPRESVNWK
jgi:hypothetical protein